MEPWLYSEAGWGRGG